MKINDAFPLDVLKDQRGENFSMESLLGQPFVVYFYPKDDTPGCTKQACRFRDLYEDFQDLHVPVVGISSDSPISHAQFAKKHNLPFTLLSDPNNAFRKKVGVPTNLLGLMPGRVTYVMNGKGKVIHTFNSQLKAEQHIDEALRAVKNEFSS
ncbi:MAG: peroxiredoxin [Cryomorphaceae bacterium]|nr:peroxiredoxin [Cryomorphaceae bacterium]